MLEAVRKFLSRGAIRGAGNGQQRWLQDPLSHPTLSNMTLVELADLPLGRARFAECRPTGGGEKPGD